MTEAAAYPAACLAFLAIVAAAESPTVTRQILALGAIALATGVRLQLAVLGAALVVALVLQPVVSRGRRPGRADLRGCGRLGAAVAVALVVGIAKIVGGNPLAGYDGLWQSYDVLEVARWSWRALGGLAFYLALVPVVVAPAALRILAREGRAGRAASAAALTLACSVTVSSCSSSGRSRARRTASGFSTTATCSTSRRCGSSSSPCGPSGGSRSGASSLVAGSLLAVVLVATLPPYLLAKDGGRLFDAVASALPG